MRMKKALEGFKISCLANGYSPSTLATYESSLKVLVHFLENPHVENVTHKDLEKFMVFLKQDYEPQRFGGDTSPLSSGRIHGYWKALRTFFAWIGREFDLDEEPAMKIQRPRHQHRQPEPYTEDEIKALLSVCDLTESGHVRHTAKRDRALIMLLLDTGLRRGELLRMQFGDIHSTGVFYELEIQSFNSGIKSKPRTVYTGRACSRFLREYLNEKKQPLKHDLLFTTSKGHPIKGSSLLNMIKRLAVRANIEDANIHRFRHTFAIQYLRNGGGMMTLQRLLGHSTLDMVTNYLKLANTDAKNAHRTASPADRWRL